MTESVSRFGLPDSSNCHKAVDCRENWYRERQAALLGQLVRSCMPPSPGNRMDFRATPLTESQFGAHLMQLAAAEASVQAHQPTSPCPNCFYVALHSFLAPPPST